MRNVNDHPAINLERWPKSPPSYICSWCLKTLGAEFISVALLAEDWEYRFHRACHTAYITVGEALGVIHD